MNVRALLVVASITWLACGGEEEVQEEPCDFEAVSAARAAPASFTEVQATFRSCGLSSCHGRPLATTGEVVIDDDAAKADQVYTGLVNAAVAEEAVVESTNETRGPGNVPLRVDPGNPRNSFLLWKVVGHDPGDPSVPVVGDRMPVGSRLSCDQIAAIHSWIAAGATR